MYSNYIPLPLPRLPLIALTDLLPSNYFFSGFQASPKIPSYLWLLPGGYVLNCGQFTSSYTTKIHGIFSLENHSLTLIFKYIWGLMNITNPHQSHPCIC